MYYFRNVYEIHANVNMCKFFDLSLKDVLRLFSQMC